MNKIKKLLFAVALFPAAMAMASEYPWLTFTLTDNSTFSVGAENLTLDYADGSLKLSSPSVDRMIPVAQLVSMEFTAESSGSAVQELPAEGDLSFFEPGGRAVGSFHTLAEARSSLGEGVYIVVSDGQTFKVAL